MKLLANQADHFLCYYTLVLDSYSKFCDIGCIYCYAQDFTEDQSFGIDIEFLEKTFEEVFEKKISNPWTNILTKRIPIRLGFETDPFQVMEKKFKMTKRVLELFKKYDYPHIIFTKSELILEDEYLDLLSPSRSYVQVSISSNNENLAKAVEPRAPSPTSRLNIVKKLSQRNIPVAVRVNLLPQSLRQGSEVLDDNKYIENVTELIEKSDATKIILNEIIDRNKEENNSLNMDQKLWDSWTERLTAMGKTVSYCYLGSSSSRFYQFDNPSCQNCCQCDLSKSYTTTDVSTLDHFKIEPFPQSILSFVNSLILKLMMYLLKKAQK